MAGLTEKMAQQIVHEMEKIIAANINIMNKDGIIIASKDTNRIGTFHEGARQVIEQGSTVSVYPDDTLQGAKPGVNMPIHFHEELLGVIGVTGHPDEVGDYAKIIHKMTEVMVKEAYVSKELNLEKRAKELFIQEWMQRHWGSREGFQLRGKTLSIRTDITRQAILFKNKGTENNKKETEVARQERMGDLLKRIQEGLATREDDLLTFWKSDHILLLKEIEDKVWYNRLEMFVASIPEKYGAFVCGIGRENNGLEGTVQSFEEASLALKFVGKRESPVLFFKDLGIESLLHSIPDDKMEDFIDRFFPFFYEKEHEQLVLTLRAFLENDQSIGRTSNTLFIHKNTLQYRLKKMKELTGYDPRTFQDAVLYWIALNYFASK